MKKIHGDSDLCGDFELNLRRSGTFKLIKNSEINAVLIQCRKTAPYLNSQL